ncbi:hypothetical protein ACYSNU_18535 [Enterococcus sp. LJL120]
MIKGKTKSGFVYQISEDCLNDYELLEMVGQLEEEPLILTKVVNSVLGAKQATALKNHVRTEDGRVPLNIMESELTEIFQNQNETKNF